jgi:hypothetical protein
MSFNLSGLPAGVLPSDLAEATLYCFTTHINSQGPPISLAPVTSSWIESTVNGNPGPSIGPTLGSMPFPATAEIYAWGDVTSFVQQWISNPASNYGIDLALSSGSLQFASKESTTTPGRTELQILLNNPGAPAFNPAAGSYSGQQNVTLASSTGATIRYTLDGSQPSETNGTVCAGPISIGASTTINAIAYKAGLADSAVTTAAYVIQ